MIQFNLLGFPIRIHWPFWLTAALLGGALHAQTPAQIQRVLIWVVLVLVSIIIHELGHALTMRRFGDRRVEIALYALGGLAIGSTSYRTRLQQILISAAGPAAQIAAGFVVYLIYKSFPPPPGLLYRAYQDFFFISFFWAAINLLPIIPLDGGRITEALFGPRKQRIAYTLSMIIAAIAAVYFIQLGALFAGLFFGMMAFNNWKALNHQPQTDWMNLR